MRRAAERSMTDFAASPRTRSSRSSPARRRPRAAVDAGWGGEAIGTFAARAAFAAFAVHG
ncbi:hypothetical protein DIJ60_35700 [Burkholderia pseudomallei]|nr:hypothetical protein DIJ60_35700 [Burkholderia pseudomallei]